LNRSAKNISKSTKLGQRLYPLGHYTGLVIPKLLVFVTLWWRPQVAARGVLLTRIAIRKGVKMYRCPSKCSCNHRVPSPMGHDFLEPPPIWVGLSKTTTPSSPFTTPKPPNLISSTSGQGPGLMESWALVWGRDGK
jgi:hypothetical protein